MTLTLLNFKVQLLYIIMYTSLHQQRERGRKGESREKSKGWFIRLLGFGLF